MHFKKKLYNNFTDFNTAAFYITGLQFFPLVQTFTYSQIKGSGAAIQWAWLPSGATWCLEIFSC